MHPTLLLEEKSLKDKMERLLHIALAELSRGEQAQVQTIEGGANLISRMASMGLTPGAEVTIMQNFPRMPLIINVRYTFIALGREEAGRVYVDRAEGGRLKAKG